MFKFIKRMFGLDYNDPKPNTHSGVGYSGETEVKDESSAVVHNGVGHLGVQVEVAEVPEVVVESKPVREKKPRKPAAKKAAPKKTTKKK
jgi:hypothetical protein